jgi:DNA-binding MarR family transcriptional regulator
MRREIASASQNKLSLPQFRIMQHIAGNCRAVGVLAVAHGVSQPAMSVLVDRLVRDGYVTRARDENDGRRQELALSASGQAILRQTTEQVEAQMALALEFLRPDARDAIKRDFLLLGEAFAIERVDEALRARRPAPTGPEKTKCV